MSICLNCNTSSGFTAAPSSSSRHAQRMSSCEQTRLFVFPQITWHVLWSFSVYGRIYVYRRLGVTRTHRVLFSRFYLETTLFLPLLPKIYTERRTRSSHMGDHASASDAGCRVGILRPEIKLGKTSQKRASGRSCRPRYHSRLKSFEQARACCFSYLVSIRCPSLKYAYYYSADSDGSECMPMINPCTFPSIHCPGAFFRPFAVLSLFARMLDTVTV